MEEKVEAKTQINPEKKSKTRMLLVLLFLAIKGSSIEEETINSLKPLPNIFTKYILY